MKLKPYHYAWFLCLAVLAGFFLLAPQAPKPHTQDTAAIAGAASFGGAFTLTDHNGNSVTEQSWPDKYKIFYFGFTFCPDVCPLGLSRIANALQSLPPAMQEKIQPVFVTVDPARDTTGILKNYAPLFYPSMIGLTGSNEQIEHIKKLFKVYAEKAPATQDGNADDYMVNHSAFTYFLTPDNRLAGIYPHEATAAEIAADIRTKIVQE